MTTRIVRLRDERLRDRRTNPRTQLWSRHGAGAGEPEPGEPSCEVAFVTSYPAIRKEIAGVTERCLAVFAVDEHGVCGHARLVPHADGVQTAILGRHTSTDLLLGADDRISLRHLALVIPPSGGAEPLRYRLLDLRTGRGMRDEQGRRVDHVAAEGPLLVTVAHHVLICLPLPGPSTWPTDPLEAWRALPPRAYVEPAGAGRPSPPEVAPGATAVQVLAGARFAGPSTSGDEQVGALHLRSALGQARLVVSARALRSGVLIGRYDRCDNAAQPVLADERISRVHVLLLQVGEATWAIDTASTNGLWHARTGLRQRALAHGDELELGSRLAWLRWEAMA